MSLIQTDFGDESCFDFNALVEGIETVDNDNSLTTTSSIEAFGEQERMMYKSYRAMKLKRREGGQGLTTLLIESDEIDLIVELKRLTPNDPIILLAYANSLAETLRKYSPDDPNIPLIPFGTKVWMSGLSHILHTIRGIAMRILSIEPMSLKLNLGLATLSSSTVPYWAKDQAFSKECLQRALLFHSNSSRACVRMAYFALTEKNYELALGSFEKAIYENEEDISAVVGVLYSIMRFVKERGLSGVAGILKDALLSDCWSAGERAQILYIKGVYQLLGKDAPKPTISNWITAMELCPNSLELCFQKLGQVKKQFGWQEEINELYTLPNFNVTIKSVLDSFEDRKIFRKVRALRSLIKKVGRKELIEDAKKAEVAEANKNAGIVDRRYFLQNKLSAPQELLGATDETKLKMSNRAREILGIPTDKKTTIDRIEYYYRKLCIKFNSSKGNALNLSNEEEEEKMCRMREINWAFAVLIRIPIE